MGNVAESELGYGESVSAAGDIPRARAFPTRAPMSAGAGGTSSSPAAHATLTARRSAAAVDEDATVMFESTKLTLAFNFWKDKVATLDRSQQKILGLLLFSNLFKKSKEARALFTTTDITKQSLRLLDMFGWLLRTLDSRDARIRSKTLTALGERHVTYGVKTKFFEPMFDALDLGLSEMFDEDYTEEIAQSIRSLFTQAAEQMMIDSVVTEEESVGPRWLMSLEFALADPVGFSALTQYLHMVKHGELAEFHRAFQIYRAVLDDSTRTSVGAEIFRVFFSSEASLVIRGFSSQRKLEHDVSTALRTGSHLPLDLFDSAHSFVKRQIMEVAWAGFKKAHKDAVPMA